MSSTTSVTVATPNDVHELSLLDMLVPLLRYLRLLVVGPLIGGVVAWAITFAIQPTFAAKTTFLPAQQQQTTAASALTQLGALAGLTGSIGGIKNPSDQYVALMESDAVADRIIDRFDLMRIYDRKYRVDARQILRKNIRITIGKKNGLIYVEVDDKDRHRAAAIANQLVEELRSLTGSLALSEAQQRRMFFESQLKASRDRLTNAQQALEESGFSQGALRAEPKAAAEAYARLKAEVTAAEVKMQTLRRTLADSAAEVQQQHSTLRALRAQLNKLEQSIRIDGDPDYVSKYREFKFQETLFELFAKQYEQARVDESREGTLIQVIDKAVPPEKQSGPRRGFIAAAATVATLVLLAIGVIALHLWRIAVADPVNAGKLESLRTALRGH